jgi:hypothetical protein
MQSESTTKIAILKFQQYIHLGAVFIFIILYLLSKRITSQGSDDLKLVQTIIEVGGIVWTAWVAILTLRHGAGIDIPKQVFETYRRNLSILPLISFLNGIILAGISILIYQLICFRDIEVVANRNADLILSDKPGEMIKIATLEQGKRTKIRLKVGPRLLVARSGEEAKTIDEITINPIWKRNTTEMIEIIFQEHRYESTH